MIRPCQKVWVVAQWRKTKKGSLFSDWIRVSKLEGWYRSKVRDNHPLRSCKISQIAAFRIASQPEGGVECFQFKYFGQRV
jgi:hypothetical protein